MAIERLRAGVHHMPVFRGDRVHQKLLVVGFEPSLGGVEEREGATVGGEGLLALREADSGVV
jgi:hypothetical protein